MEEEQKKTKQMKRRGEKRITEETMKLNQNRQKLNGYYVQKIGRDIVIMYVPHINDIAIDDNYADIF